MNIPPPIIDVIFKYWQYENFINGYAKVELPFM